MNPACHARTALIGLAAATLAAWSAARAQSTIHALVTLTPTWEEVNGNNNGLLEPGESARMRLRMSFSPAVNTAIQYTPQGGGTATGTMRGFGSGYFDLAFGTAGAGSIAITGETGGVPNGRAAAWSVVPGGNGVVQGNAIVNIQPAQFPFNCLDSDPVLNPQGVRTDNPVESIYVAVWTPASYTARTVQVELVGGVAGPPFGSVLLQSTSNPNQPPLAVESFFDYRTVDIPVIPAPGVVTALIGAGAVLGRRRRCLPTRGDAA
jgi:hypothetical protein